MVLAFCGNDAICKIGSQHGIFRLGRGNNIGLEYNRKS